MPSSFLPQEFCFLVTNINSKCPFPPGAARGGRGGRGGGGGEDGGGFTSGGPARRHVRGAQGGARHVGLAAQGWWRVIIVYRFFAVGQFAVKMNVSFG